MDKRSFPFNQRAILHSACSCPAGSTTKLSPVAKLRPLSLVACIPEGMSPAPQVVTLLQALAAAGGSDRHSSVLSLAPFHTGLPRTAPAPLFLGKRE